MKCLQDMNILPSKDGVEWTRNTFGGTFYHSGVFSDAYRKKHERQLRNYTALAALSVYLVCGLKPGLKIRRKQTWTGCLICSPAAERPSHQTT